MEGAVLVARTDVALEVSPGPDKIEIVNGLFVEAYTEAVAVQMLHAPTDVGALEDGLVESYLASAFVGYRQSAALGPVRPFPGSVIHLSDQLAVLSGVGKRLVLDGHVLFARQEENVTYAHAVGMERPYFPCLAVVPDGKSLARDI